VTADWRTDPGWKLAEFDAGYWATLNRKLPPLPPAEAELAQPPAWCSVIVQWNGRLATVATWYRQLV
jgi:hypothetical protein